MIKPSIVAIFAHPDDEAFGPGGSLATLAKDHDVYILCATRGEAGQNNLDDKNVNLSHERENELRNSARILGVKEVHFLDFIDGTLCNNLYHKIADKVTEYLDKIKPGILITYEPHGISGHIDHIVMSMVTSFVAEKLPYIQKVMYYCILKEYSQKQGTYFIYFPPGYDKKDIDEEIDTEPVWDTKVKAMLEHKSQKSDAERILKRYADFSLPKKEYFIVKTKNGQKLT